MLNKKYLFADYNENNMKIKSKTVSFSIPSFGELIYGRFLLPCHETEEDLAPVLVMLHGYPGLEQNMDMPPAFRRGGIATLHFSYRGVWGSHGFYSFSHLMEDTFTVVQWIREHAKEYHVDPNRIYLLGHSMGGFTALNAISQGLPIKGAVILAPCDMAMRYEEEREIFNKMMKTVKKGYFRLPNDEFLENEMRDHYKEWRFLSLAEKIPSDLPLCFIGGSLDTTVPPRRHIFPLYDLLVKRGMHVSYHELIAGHIFAPLRITLTDLIFDSIADMEKTI